MYTASSFTVSLLFHDGLRCTLLLGTCKTQPGEVPCSTVGQEGSRDLLLLKGRGAGRKMENWSLLPTNSKADKNETYASSKHETQRKR